MSDLMNLKWRIQYGGKYYLKSLHSPEICYSGVVGVADYESDVRFFRFNMADPIWRTNILELIDFYKT